MFAICIKYLQDRENEGRLLDLAEGGLNHDDRLCMPCEVEFYAI